MRVAIAGAGIAGLAAAVALARRGIDATIHEREPVLRDIGAGIQLSPNAMAVLAELGVLPLIEADLSYPEAIAMADARTGRALARLPLNRLGDRHGHRYAVAHRADLQAALLQRSADESGIGLTLGSPVIAVAERDEAIGFTAGDAEEAADVLVAANGIHSALRAAVPGQSVAGPLSRSAWRATVARAAIPPGVLSRNETGLWLAPGRHIVHYPLRAGAELNVVVIGTGAPEGPPPLDGLCEGLGWLAAVPDWRGWPLLAVDPAAPWTHGRLVLIGDAAHAMAPSAAQGGAMALEDAWVLARCLAEGRDDVPEALRRFETERRPRVARVAASALRNLRIYELSGPPAWGRNAVLRLMPGERHLTSLDWLYGRKPA